jgi:single-strand DNA-binding protein
MAKGTINKVMIEGILGNKPKFRTTRSGTVVAKLIIATNARIGENITTKLHRVVVVGKLAESIQQYVHKGSQLFVEGRLNINSNTQYATEMIANKVEFIIPF